MLEPPGFPATQACWSRSVLPPPMTLPGLSAFGSLPVTPFGCFFVFLVCLFYVLFLYSFFFRSGDPRLYPVDLGGARCFSSSGHRRTGSLPRRPGDLAPSSPE
ncbi:hypothetical protein SLEP1_g45178 [Rubroshorea leprosula]|uniref:ATP synthase F0 subunit 8 n=1 Tax=Rubroshorea leprosula TaxID=152421 RepID=A0AAV5LID3_9ROSI|nr:hypothetical protein SLEP1_g45178 [Rubroshorea leprosula]